jgi:hypothetical protein
MSGTAIAGQRKHRDNTRFVGLISVAANVAESD